jgi:hypothetical protein
MRRHYPPGAALTPAGRVHPARRRSSQVSSEIVRVTSGAAPSETENTEMIILGVVLLLIGILAGIPILTTIGTILLVVGAVLFILGSVGRPVGGRRYWY